MNQVRNLAQAYSQAPWRKQMTAFAIVGGILAFSALVAALYLTVTARATAIGRDIQGLNRDMQKLEHENAVQAGKLAELNSNSAMEKRANDLGYIPVTADDLLYIAVEGYSPRLAVTIGGDSRPTLSGAPALPPEYTESIFMWVKRTWYAPSSPFRSFLEAQQ